MIGPRSPISSTRRARQNASKPSATPSMTIWRALPGLRPSLLKTGILSYSEFYAVAESHDIAEKWRVVFVRDGTFACHPFQEISIQHFQNMFKFVELLIREANKIGIGILP